MKKLIFTKLFLLFCAAMYAQTTVPKGVTKKEVLDKYFKAIGRFEKVKKVKTVYVVEKFSQQGTLMELHKKYMQPFKFSIEVHIMGNVVYKMAFD